MIDNLQELNKQVENTQPTVAQPQKKFNPQQKPQKNLWEDQNIKALNPNILEKKSGNRSFTVYYNSRDTNIPDEIKTKMTNAVKFLSGAGYTFRAWYSGDDMLGSSLARDFVTPTNQNIQWYIPWKKYNEKVPNPTSFVRNELAFQLARGVHKGWDKLPPVVRALCARDVEVMLTQDGKHPLTFVIVYSPCGSEELPDNPDYQSLGQLAFVFRLAKILSIPVFNLKNDNVSSRIQDLINGKAPAEAPKPETPAVTEQVQSPAPQPQQQEVTVKEPDPVPSQPEQPKEEEVDPINELLG